MTAYRFCRTDDVPLLVHAHNACYAEPAGTRPITVEDFRRWRRELDVWCSSCMVAFEGSDPIGVLIAAKRAHASWIHCIGVRPEHRRRGHARHMLESLARKMAILEPDLLLAEVSSENAAARSLLEACGWSAGDTMVDWFAEPLSGSSGESGLAPASDAGLARPGRVTWDDLESAGIFTTRREPLTWLRSTENLRAIRDQLQGLAVVSDLRVEAWLLYHEPAETGTREIAGAAADQVADAALLTALLREARRSAQCPVRMSRVHPREVDPASLRSAGYQQTSELVAYSTAASSG